MKHGEIGGGIIGVSARQPAMKASAAGVAASCEHRQAS